MKSLGIFGSLRSKKVKSNDEGAKQYKRMNQSFNSIRGLVSQSVSILGNVTKPRIDISMGPRKLEKSLQNLREQLAKEKGELARNSDMTKARQIGSILLRLADNIKAYRESYNVVLG